MSNVQWSKSIVLENKVAINFDFRSGAKKSGHLDYPLQSYGPKFVNMPKYAYNFAICKKYKFDCCFLFDWFLWTLRRAQILKCV